MEKLAYYRSIINEALKDFLSDYTPEVVSLYEPIRYALEGGKKIRPASVLLSTEAFGGEYKHAIDIAIAVEMFHNFTLIHDDIMDNSPMRRGKPTVYHKWSQNQAILSGDALLILVYKKLESLPPKKIYSILELLNNTALAVCEGQQLDLEFETKDFVSEAEYLKMIKLKTSVLIGASLAMGAIIADADKDAISEIYNFGVNLGIAFQIQDDLFDVYADEQTFGKKIGNDILTNKKTFLVISAYSKADALIREELRFAFANLQGERKIFEVKRLYDELNIKDVAIKRIEEYYNKALKNLNQLNIDAEGKKIFEQYANYILKRTY